MALTFYLTTRVGRPFTVNRHEQRLNSLEIGKKLSFFPSPSWSFRYPLNLFTAKNTLPCCVFAESLGLSYLRALPEATRLGIAIAEQPGGWMSWPGCGVACFFWFVRSKRC